MCKYIFKNTPADLTKLLKINNINSKGYAIHHFDKFVNR